MNRRLILSFVMIAVAIAGVTGATVAYFSDLTAKTGNTFATGTVVLNKTDFKANPLNFLNLAPGVPQTQQVSFGYLGSINADVYVGARGTSHPGDTDYIADKLDITITEPGIKDWYIGKVSGLSTAWQKIAENVGQNVTKTYNVTLTLDPNVDNTYQNRTNTDTEILLYSVQQGGTFPSTLPYETTGG
jgi:predicted ribosomally synthesized peptide with SipW-like signal peptide